MSNGFDAYHKWLSIPPHDQPPNHYRLLGLGLFESDPDVVAAAADRQMAHVQTYKTGPHSELSQKLLNEISAAKLCLLRPQKKAAYDDQLRQKLSASPAAFGGFGAAAPSPSIGSQPKAGLPAGISSTETPPAGVASMGAARLSNPAPYANVGSENAFAPRPGAMAGAAVAGMPRGTPYPGLSNAPITPPPPTLPPPVTDASPHASISTTTILIAAGAMAVLLLIGIVIALRHGNARSTDSSGVEKPEVNPGPESSNPATVSFPGPQEVLPKNPTPSPRPDPTHGTTGIAKNIGVQGTNGNNSPPKPAVSPAAVDPVKKPPPHTGSEVATTVPPGNHPAEKNPFDKANPEKTNPVRVTPVKPVVDPALAGKAAVPDNVAIVAIEQRLGITAESLTADLLDQAHKSTEPTEIYVLLRHALDSAIKQGDAASAISTVDELARRFAVNSLEVRSRTLTDLQVSVRTSESLGALAEAAATLIDEATTSAQPELAQRMAELSITSARKSGNMDVIRKITLRIIHMRTAPAPNSLPPAANPR